MLVDKVHILLVVSPLLDIDGDFAFLCDQQPFEHIVEVFPFKPAYLARNGIFTGAEVEEGVLSILVCGDLLHKGIAARNHNGGCRHRFP